MAMRRVWAVALAGLLGAAAVFVAAPPASAGECAKIRDKAAKEQCRAGIYEITGTFAWAPGVGQQVSIRCQPGDSVVVGSGRYTSSGPIIFIAEQYGADPTRGDYYLLSFQAPESVGTVTLTATCSRSNT
jgi:hypothetical protein